MTCTEKKTTTKCFTLHPLSPRGEELYTQALLSDFLKEQDNEENSDIYRGLLPYQIVEHYGSDGSITYSQVQA